MENPPFEDVLILKMGKFYCYVSLLEGNRHLYPHPQVFVVFSQVGVPVTMASVNDESSPSNFTRNNIK